MLSIVFYSNLFSSEMTPDRKIVMEDCFKLIPLKISKEEQINLSKNISVGEIEAAIDSFPNGKSPGLDGFSAEFYKINKSWIFSELLGVYEEAFKKGSLGGSINKGVIKLFPKVGDKSLVKNWRPITLLNISYKILAKMLARRIALLLNKFVSQTQTGFIQGRSILENMITSWEAMN